MRWTSDTHTPCACHAHTVQECAACGCALVAVRRVVAGDPGDERKAREYAERFPSFNFVDGLEVLDEQVASAYRVAWRSCAMPRASHMRRTSLCPDDPRTLARAHASMRSTCTCACLIAQRAALGLGADWDRDLYNEPMVLLLDPDGKMRYVLSHRGLTARGVLGQVRRMRGHGHVHRGRRSPWPWPCVHGDEHGHAASAYIWVGMAARAQAHAHAHARVPGDEEAALGSSERRHPYLDSRGGSQPPGAVQ